MWDLEAAMYAWLALALAAGIFEVASPHFGSIFISVGAVAAGVMAYLEFGWLVQSVVFTVVLLVSLGTLRKRLAGRLGGPGVPSRTDALIGKHGVVTHAIDPLLGSGRVTVGGEDWAARSTDPVPVGTTVRVISADGIVLEVTRA
jgi:membrane protein implicated in regulation of membrane protease activity